MPKLNVAILPLEAKLPLPEFIYLQYIHQLSTHHLTLSTARYKKLEDNKKSIWSSKSVATLLIC